MKAGPFRLAAALALTLVCTVAPLPAQSSSGVSQSPPAKEQSRPPAFRSTIDVVPITVTVTDARGNPLTGLTQQDFRVVENGTPREIVSFHPQTLEAGEPTPPVMQIGRSIASGPSTRRMFLIVLPLGRIQEPTKALDGAIAFVKARLLPQDAVSVLAFHRVTPFMTNHEAVATILARYRAEHERLVGEIRRFFAMTRNPSRRIRARLPIEVDLGLPIRGGPDLPAALKSDIDRSLFHGVVPIASLRNSSDLLLGMDLATTAGDRSYKRQYVFAELLRELRNLGLTLSDAVLQSSPLKLFAGIEHLRFMEGERHLVYLGGAPPIAHSADIARLFASRANDARVVINQVWTSGTALRGESGCPPCRDLVELTGGFYSSLDMMETALAKVDQRSRSFYLLGYTPSSTVLDHQYRHVRVEVARSGVTVSFRHGYFASEETPPLEMKSFVATTRSKTLEAFDENALDIGLQLEAEIAPLRPGSAERHVRLDITVDVSALGITLADGFHTGTLEVSAFCGDGKEKVIGQTKVAWTLRADGPTWADWSANGLKRTMRVPVTGNARFAKVVVYDPGSDRAGSVSVPVRQMR